MLRAGSFVLAVLGHLHQLVDGVQQAVAVLPEQPLVEPLVSEAHFQQHRHQGRVLSSGWVNTSLEGRGKEGDEMRVGGAVWHEATRLPCGQHEFFCLIGCSAETLDLMSVKIHTFFFYS